MAADSRPITITLAGRPVTARILPDTIVAYLKRKCWSGPTHPPSAPALRFWCWADGRQFNVYVPLPTHKTPRRLMRAAFREIADYEDRHPLDVLADIQAEEQSKP